LAFLRLGLLTACAFPMVLEWVLLPIPKPLALAWLGYLLPIFGGLWLGLAMLAPLV